MCRSEENQCTMHGSKTNDSSGISGHDPKSSFMTQSVSQTPQLKATSLELDLYECVWCSSHLMASSHTTGCVVVTRVEWLESERILAYPDWPYGGRNSVF